MTQGRDEWIRARLDNWARWMLSSADMALGYPRQAAFTRRIPVPSCTDSGRIPIDDVEARATHDAIEALRFEAPHLHLVLHCRYVGDPRQPANRRRPLSVAETGEVMCAKPATVYAHVARACEAVRARLGRGCRSFTE